MWQKVKSYTQIMRLDKPIGIYLLLWPTLWALWIAAQGVPHWHVLWVFVCGVVVMRSAGCVMNDIADRHFDKHVARTRSRPLTAGHISLLEASLLFVVLILLAFALVLTLNSFTIALAVIGLLLAVVYPFMKRFIHMPQAVLGCAFAWAVPMAFAAETNQLSWMTWWLFVAVLLWPIAYDTMYAIVDKDDDAKLGLKSTALYFGRYDRFIIACLQLIIWILLVWIGYLNLFGLVYFLFVAFAGLLFLYQQWLIRDRDPKKCFKAFLNNHYVGLLVFLGLCLGQ